MFPGHMLHKKQVHEIIFAIKDTDLTECDFPLLYFRENAKVSHLPCISACQVAASYLVLHDYLYFHSSILPSLQKSNLILF